MFERPKHPRPYKPNVQVCKNFIFSWKLQPLNADGVCESTKHGRCIILTFIFGYFPDQIVWFYSWGFKNRSIVFVQISFSPLKKLSKFMKTQGFGFKLETIALSLKYDCIRSRSTTRSNRPYTHPWTRVSAVDIQHNFSHILMHNPYPHYSISFLSTQGSFFRCRDAIAIARAPAEARARLKPSKSTDSRRPKPSSSGFEIQPRNRSRDFSDPSPQVCWILCSSLISSWTSRKIWVEAESGGINHPEVAFFLLCFLFARHGAV